ncbi:hypothetical protein [Ochrobactrum sp. AN78]|uniref:hypothetical protein n=1 Tax=Ochrobactrum sp. AN78 TaxID=3039853 RepID=UPI002989FF5B|nr:hypothetical protein [Ochrobactrum sp. AN78]MDH7791614.1 hypothetical protein [Ochrobactrum sp. AN78]
MASLQVSNYGQVVQPILCFMGHVGIAGGYDSCFSKFKMRRFMLDNLSSHKRPTASELCTEPFLPCLGDMEQELSEPSQDLSFSFRMGNADYTRTSAVAKVVKLESDTVAAVIYSVYDRFNRVLASCLSCAFGLSIRDEITQLLSPVEGVSFSA